MAKTNRKTTRTDSEALAAIKAASFEAKSAMMDIDAMINSLVARRVVWANVMALESLRDEMKEIREDLKARLELGA